MIGVIKLLITEYRDYYIGTTELEGTLGDKARFIFKFGNVFCFVDVTDKDFFILAERRNDLNLHGKELFRLLVKEEYFDRDLDFIRGIFEHLKAWRDYGEE